MKLAAREIFWFRPSISWWAERTRQMSAKLAGVDQESNPEPLEHDASTLHSIHFDTAQ
jgi:hypothetical protein